MGKEYVDVIIKIIRAKETVKGETKEVSKTTPLFYKLRSREKWIKIESVNNAPRRMASYIAGAVGIRYSAVVDVYGVKKEIYLFDEGDYNWFIETENEEIGKNSKRCWYCGHELVNKPVLEKRQTRYSVLCPYCRTARLIEWKDTREEAVAAWDEFMQDGLLAE